MRSYGQRDPLVEYKKEAFELFSNLLEKLKLDYVTILMNLKVVVETNQNKESKREDKFKEIKKIILVYNKKDLKRVKLLKLKNVSLVPGGINRQQSTLNALKYLLNKRKNSGKYQSYKTLHSDKSYL